jgi:hypothetical protein
MVLSDGETFTNLDDCQIVEVPDDSTEVRDMGYPVVCKFGTYPINNEGKGILVEWFTPYQTKMFAETRTVFQRGS